MRHSTLTVALLSLSFGALAQQTDSTTIQVAPKLGLWKSTSRLDAAAYTALQIDYIIPALDRALSVGLELSWMRPKYSGTSSDPQLRATDASFAMGVAQFGAALVATYRFRDLLYPGLTPYVGGGPGLYSHRAAVTAFAENSLEKESKPGFELMAGAGYVAGPGAAFFEIQGRLARTDFSTTGFVNLGGFAFAAGYRFGF